jgi:hypothetical protein
MRRFFLESGIRARRHSRVPRELFCAACLVAAMATAKVCLADASSVDGHATPDEPQSKLRRRWYGWQTFSVDGVAAGLLLGAVTTNGAPALDGCSAVSFVIGGPIVHLAHGQWEMALGSAGTRIVAPLFGAIIGSQFDGAVHSTGSGQTSGSSSKWTATGAAIGGLVASAVDGLLFAYDEKPAPAVEQRHAQVVNIEATPTFVAINRGFMIGLSGNL